MVGQTLRVPRLRVSVSSRKVAGVMISAGPWGFLLSRMAMWPGRRATSMQLLPPPDDLVLVRQVAAERSAEAVGFMGVSPGLLVEEGGGLPGGEGGCLEGGEFELITFYFVVFLQHAVVDGGFDVDDVALAVGEGEVEEGLAGDRVDAGGDRQDLHGDVRAAGGLGEADGLAAEDGGVGDPGQGVLVDDGVQLAGVVIAGEDGLTADPGLGVPADLGGVGDSGGPGDELDVAGNLEQAGDEGGLEGPDLCCACFPAGEFLAAEHVVVLGPPASFAAFAGQGDQGVAFGPVDTVQVAQVGDRVGDRLGPAGFLDPVEFGRGPAQAALDVGGGHAAALAVLDQLAGQGALADGRAVAGAPDLVHASRPGRCLVPPHDSATTVTLYLDNRYTDYLSSSYLWFNSFPSHAVPGAQPGCAPQEEGPGDEDDSEHRRAGPRQDQDLPAAPTRSGVSAAVRQASGGRAPRRR